MFSNKLFLSISCLSLIAPSSVFAAGKYFPTPSTLSSSMAGTVSAPAPALWQIVPETTEQLQKMLDDRASVAGEAALKVAGDSGVKVEEMKSGNVPVFVLTPKNLSPATKDKVIFYIHGGGYILGKGVGGIIEAIPMAAQNGYKVICVDYRTAPKYPFPAAIDDAFAAYRETVKQYGAQNIVVFGTSTGGAMTLILALQAYAAGIPLPAALISGTPWADIDKIGDSYFVNDGVDNVLGSYDHLIKTAAEVYVKGHDMRDPLISPVYADDSVLKHFPPTLLISGTRDLFLSNTVRMHTRLLLNKVHSELIVYEALSHAQYYLNPTAPETHQHYQLVGDFLNRIWEK